MRPFPWEEEQSAEVSTTFAGLFDAAEALYNFWLTHPKDQWMAKS
jgi:hypothetical protein